MAVHQIATFENCEHIDLYYGKRSRLSISSDRGTFYLRRRPFSLWSATSWLTDCYANSTLRKRTNWNDTSIETRREDSLFYMIALGLKRNYWTKHHAKIHWRNIATTIPLTQLVPWCSCLQNLWQASERSPIRSRHGFRCCHSYTNDSWWGITREQWTIRTERFHTLIYSISGYLYFQKLRGALLRNALTDADNLHTGV